MASSEGARAVASTFQYRENILIYREHILISAGPSSRGRSGKGRGGGGGGGRANSPGKLREMSEDVDSEEEGGGDKFGVGFRVGDRVLGLYKPDGKWYGAVIARCRFFFSGVCFGIHNYHDISITSEK